MRVRFGILVLILAATLTACGGDDDKDAGGDTPSTSAPTTTPTSTDATDPDAGAVPCEALLAGRAKALQLSSSLRPGTDVTDDIKDAESEFDALKVGAPEEIQRALDEVKAAFAELAEAYKSKTPDEEKVAVLNSRLGENAQKLDSYINGNCS